MALRYIFLREGLPVNQELTFWVILSGEQAPSIQLSLSSSTEVEGYTITPSYLYVGAGDTISDPPDYIPGH